MIKKALKNNLIKIYHKKNLYVNYVVFLCNTNKKKYDNIYNNYKKNIRFFVIIFFLK